MKFASIAVASLVALGVSALPQQGNVRRAPCKGNTKDTRKEWCDFNIDTDWYENVPDTGVTRTYDFKLTVETGAPNGVQRQVKMINGQIPGPPIIADWGDWVEVHVDNLDSHNATGIHFHGIIQNGTFQSDGVPSITQCPVRSDSGITYKWRAHQYGSSWYHSHFSDQAWDGVFGGITINGPASENYDEDLGVLFLNDWDTRTADQLQFLASHNSFPVITQEHGLINGTNTKPGDTSSGKRYENYFKSNTTYRLRVVNAAIDTVFQLSLDNHTMRAIAADFVPIKPYDVQGPLVISMGQRYDLLIKADQPEGDYWLKAIPCGGSTVNENRFDIKGIIRYNRDSTAEPPATPDPATDSQKCTSDEPASSLRPWLEKSAPEFGKEVHNLTAAATQNSHTDLQGRPVWKWNIGNTTMITDWAHPSVEKVFNGDFNFTEQEAVLTLEKNEWMYLYMNNPGAFGPAHPVHLHGHDFYIISQGPGAPEDATDKNFANPPRRDTATLPQNGHLIIGWPADNPGIWLLHCHIGFHTFEGFGLQFIERASEIKALIDQDTMEQTCNDWRSYTIETGLKQDESGI